MPPRYDPESLPRGVAFCSARVVNAKHPFCHLIKAVSCCLCSLMIIEIAELKRRTTAAERSILELSTVVFLWALQFFYRL